MVQTVYRKITFLILGLNIYFKCMIIIIIFYEKLDRMVACIQ